MYGAVKLPVRRSLPLEDLVIPAGGTVARTVEFFAGELTITVTHEGEPFATPIEIENAAGKPGVQELEQLAPKRHPRPHLA